MPKRKAPNEPPPDKPPHAIAKGVAAVVAVSSAAATIYGFFTDKRIAVLALIGMIFAMMLLLVVAQAANEISKKGEGSPVYSILVKALFAFIVLYFMVGTAYLFPSLMESLKKAFTQDSFAEIREAKKAKETNQKVGEASVIQTNASTETNASPALPPSAQLMKEAFSAYNETNWHVALEKANSCIQRFETRAIAIQERCESNKAPVIAPERVIDPAIRNEIVSRGPLNDVAACYIVIGRTRLAQYEQEPNKNAPAAKDLLKKAKEAFEKASAFTYAYVYDPSSPTSFWRPAVIASAALRQEPLASQ